MNILQKMWRKNRAKIPPMRRRQRHKHRFRILRRPTRAQTARVFQKLRLARVKIPSQASRAREIGCGCEEHPKLFFANRMRRSKCFSLRKPPFKHPCHILRCTFLGRVTADSIITGRRRAFCHIVRVKIKSAVLSILYI